MGCQGRLREPASTAGRRTVHRGPRPQDRCRDRDGPPAPRVRLRDRSGRRLQLRGRIVPGTAGGPTRRWPPIRRRRPPRGDRARPVQVDVSAADVVIGEFESYLSDPVLERLGFRRSRFPVYPVNQHVAEKLHALTLPRDVENTRARDLVDLVWFIRRFTFRSEALAIACIATFERRGTHGWPPVIDIPPESWTRPYARWRSDLDLPEPTPAEGASSVRRFLEPVYLGVAGLRWDPAGVKWGREGDQHAVVTPRRTRAGQ